MKAKKATTTKRNVKNSEVLKYYKVAENMDIFKEILDTITILKVKIEECHAQTKKVMLALILKLKSELGKLKSQVFVDEIKVNDPFELIARIGQMKKDGIIEFEPMGMARTLVLSSVFVRTFTVSRDGFSKELKQYM